MPEHVPWGSCVGLRSTEQLACVIAAGYSGLGATTVHGTFELNCRDQVLLLSRTDPVPVARAPSLCTVRVSSTVGRFLK